MMNLYQLSVKLPRKIRVGARLRRRYDPPQAPLDRLLALPANAVNASKLVAYQQLRATHDPFALAEAIERKLERIYRLASRPQSRPKLIRVERETIPAIEETFGFPVVIGRQVLPPAR
jgi:hypothetical protein